VGEDIRRISSRSADMYRAAESRSRVGRRPGVGSRLPVVPSHPVVAVLFVPLFDLFYPRRIGSGDQFVELPFQLLNDSNILLMYCKIDLTRKRFSYVIPGILSASASDHAS